jgi:hypothetical protein
MVRMTVLGLKMGLEGVVLARMIPEPAWLQRPLLDDEGCDIFVLFRCAVPCNLCPGMGGDRAGFAVVVRLVLLLAVVLEQVVVDLVDPLPVGQAELVEDVGQAEQPKEVAQEVLAGQVVVEYLVVKQGGHLEAGALRVGKAQSNCIEIQEECLFLQ